MTRGVILSEQAQLLQQQIDICRDATEVRICGGDSDVLVAIQGARHRLVDCRSGRLQTCVMLRLLRHQGIEPRLSELEVLRLLRLHRAIVDEQGEQPRHQAHDSLEAKRSHDQPVRLATRTRILDRDR